ncbi:MAG TPA: type II toxin-antitoxin system VapC family toxin [Miltoncostaeaceae bacterium]|nr:type II toxin-antitoxin system VapC family toxin [Miltoncostaeaceae bacterium]
MHRLIDGLPIVVVSFTSAHARVAAEAWRRFGKGRHPAGLNLGDCMSYATARVAERPLLCVGDDFARTDLAVVPLHP